MIKKSPSYKSLRENSNDSNREYTREFDYFLHGQNIIPNKK